MASVSLAGGISINYCRGLRENPLQVRVVWVWVVFVLLQKRSMTIAVVTTGTSHENFQKYILITRITLYYSSLHHKISMAGGSALASNFKYTQPHSLYFLFQSLT